MNDAEFEIAQRSVLLMEKARATVKRNHWTDKPGNRWHLNEINYPRFNGIHNTAAIYTNDDGTAYDVHAFNYRGEEVAKVTRKTLVSAFKAGEALADKAAA